jgi:hypothetical protein
VVEGIYLKRQEPALARLDAAVARLVSLGQDEEARPLTSLAARLREDV